MSAVKHVAYLVTFSSKVYVAGECKENLCGSLPDGNYPHFTMVPLKIKEITALKPLTSALVIQSGE